MNRSSLRPSRAVWLWCAVLFAAAATPAFAYIGPGAGVALVGSFAMILVTIVAAFFAVMVWPLRMTYRLLRRKKRGKPWARRLIVVGLDGQDPKLTDRFMKEGKLPNFEKLAARGCYHRLATTFSQNPPCPMAIRPSQPTVSP